MQRKSVMESMRTFWPVALLLSGCALEVKPALVRGALPEETREQVSLTEERAELATEPTVSVHPPVMEEPPPATPVESPARPGLTFASVVLNSTPAETVLMSCHAGPRPLDNPSGESCNAYQGDTSCARSLPVLCLRPDARRAPDFSFDFYHGWSGAALRMTVPVPGRQFRSRAEADAFCAQQLGDGFRMAEFHDGNGGWSFYGWNDRVALGQRAWIAINDQRANCWD